MSWEVHGGVDTEFQCLAGSFSRWVPQEEAARLKHLFLLHARWHSGESHIKGMAQTFLWSFILCLQ